MCKFFDRGHLQFGHHGNDASRFGPTGLDFGHKSLFTDGSMHFGSIMRLYVASGNPAQCSRFWLRVPSDSGYGTDRIFNEPYFHCNYVIGRIPVIALALGFLSCGLLLRLPTTLA